jgi:antitoxin (DNA-binding transcriptional repressor) of toxin-antitoxin stability system
METVNIHQAKTHLSQLLQEVQQGREVVIAGLVAWRDPVQPVAAPWALLGRIQLTDDFEAPLEDLFEALR